MGGFSAGEPSPGKPSQLHWRICFFCLCYFLPLNGTPRLSDAASKASNTGRSATAVQRAIRAGDAALKIVEAQAGNYHGEKAAIAYNRRCLAALAISFLSLFTTASPTQQPVAGLHFPSRTAAEKPPIIDAAKKRKKKNPEK